LEKHLMHKVIRPRLTVYAQMLMDIVL
jgi:hypothetical protein